MMQTAVQQLKSLQKGVERASKQLPTLFEPQKASLSQTAHSSLARSAQIASQRTSQQNISS